MIDQLRTEEARLRAASDFYFQQANVLQKGADEAVLEGRRLYREANKVFAAATVLENMQEAEK